MSITPGLKESTRADKARPSDHEEVKLSTIYFENPASDILYLRSANYFDMVELYDLTGKLIREIHEHSNELYIQLNDYNSGMYFLVVKNKNQLLSRKKFIHLK